MVFLSSTLPLRATAKRKNLGWGWKGGVGSCATGSTPLGGASGRSSLWGRSGGRRREEEEPSACFLTLASSAELFLQWHVRPIENPFPKKNRNPPPSAGFRFPPFRFFSRTTISCVSEEQEPCVCVQIFLVSLRSKAQRATLSGELAACDKVLHLCLLELRVH